MADKHQSMVDLNHGTEVDDAHKHHVVEPDGHPLVVVPCVTPRLVQRDTRVASDHHLKQTVAG